jgi:endonuclease/exonuclease/phosphatase family metal-dependent hydrolase
VPRSKRDKNLSIRRFGPLLVSTLRQDRKSYLAQSSRGDETGNAIIASYNIHKGIGTDRRFDPHRTVMVIKEIKPDVIALQEADRRFGDRSGLLDLEILKHECGLIPAPLVVSQGGHGWHGNVVLYRQGVVTGAHQLDLPGLEPRGAVVVDLDLPAGPLRIIAAHLGLLRRSRAQQVDALLLAAKPHDKRPVMLMGDFNEWRLGGRSALQGLAPVFGPLHAAIPSFPARFPVWALDRVLANPQTIVSSVSIHDTPLARIASDHLPLKATVDLAAEKADELPLRAGMATADGDRT